MLDDHAAVRAGLRTLIAREPDLLFAGAAGDPDELSRLVEDRRPQVVVLDDHHPGRRGLQLCLEIKSRRDPPTIILYAALTPPEMIVAAAAAGADAVLNKSSSAGTLIRAVRSAATWDLSAQVSARMRSAAAARIETADHAILAMRLAGVTCGDIAPVLGTTEAHVRRRVVMILACLDAAPRTDPSPGRATPIQGDPR